MLTLTDFGIKAQQQMLFKPIRLNLEPGQVCCLMGPSGAGKSSLLSGIAGTLAPGLSPVGEVTLNQHSLLGLAAHQRQVGLLFQDDLLFPHFNVRQNLAFALAKGLSASEKKRTISDALAAAQLEGYEERDIATLSGGQKARVALLRTLLASPKLLLLDEPFAKLDQTLRQDFRQFLMSQIQQLHIPALLVTHDLQDTQGCQLLQLTQG